ncbi:hypothetical protein F4777DRAFT_589198 [Nemania sp. FL0916]|nr:hypothetical protein F4777DRAFT_589198 [Nemania sp. FL0916]
MPSLVDIPSGVALKSGCPVCYPKLQPQSQSLLCSGCKVVIYCGAGHQKEHYGEHKAACAAIIESQAEIEKEEAALRARPSDDVYTPRDIFKTLAGRFSSNIYTDDYRWARRAAINALLRVDTIKAVEEALAQSQDMLRLDRRDGVALRYIIPGLLLRLGREQECYDFLKWWAGPDIDIFTLNDMTQPYLDIRGADPFEAVDAFAKYLDLYHLVILALLKLRLYLDLDAHDPSFMDVGSPWPPEPMRPIGEIVRKKLKTITSSQLRNISEPLKYQYRALFRMVHKENSHIWQALMDSGDNLSPPSVSFTLGSVEHARAVVYPCKKAWDESYDAIKMMESEVSKFTKLYKRPPPASRGMGTLRVTPVSEKERHRGSGKVFPSKFTASAATTDPQSLFPVSQAGQDRILHFVHRNNPKKALAYTDGACSNNGQNNPEAGWAAMLRPMMGDALRPCVVSGRLELKGPFGHENAATSNRAELRAAIAALRHKEWRDDGFTSIVIATDSSYLVNGATSWARGWVRKGWTTRTGSPVKNRDLWELFLGEVEKGKETGLEVELWKIPREKNEYADRRAKEAIDEGPPQTDFENLDMRTYLATAMEALSRRPPTRPRWTEPRLKTPPPLILITDACAAHVAKVWEHVITCLRGGSTVILAASFSSFLNEGQFNRCFAKVGLPWKRGGYYRTEVSLRPGVVNNRLRQQLLPSYSQKALYVKGVAEPDVWYAGEQDEVAVAFTKVGNGMLGYLGDVNPEAGSDAAILAMLGLLN